MTFKQIVFTKNNLKIAALSTFSILLCACSNFFDTDNTPTPTPLTQFTPTVQTALLWSNRVNNGVGKDYLKLLPTANDQTIFTADNVGDVTASDKISGKAFWKINVNTELSSGPAANHDAVFIGSRTGKVIALRQTDGAILWENQLSSEILAPPAATNGVVLVKTIDGQLTGLAEKTGQLLWRYHQTEPALILRGGSAPQVTHDDVVAGFANGNLAKLTVQDGSLLWQQTIAVPQGSFAIERMVDIDADPMILNNHIYVATYQGRIAALDFSTGRELWTHDISSYTGLTADREKVYVSDATSHVWAFDAATGSVAWRQAALAARNVTAPVNMGNYIVVGDGEGYLHWLSKQDGHFVARVHVDKSGILATPLVANNIIYVLTKNGRLVAYRLV